MYDLENYNNGPIFEALAELNEKMRENNFPKIELNVIGGFAMMTHHLRRTDEYTDIDYIGDELPKKVVEIANEIGLRHNLGTNWINNDVLLSGSSLEDMEYTTGKLHFKEAFELSNMKINVIEERDLLKLKVIAVDTSLSEIESGYKSFTRKKDFRDIVALKEKLGMSNMDIKEMMGEKLLNDYTINVLKAYEVGGLESVDSLVNKIRAENILSKYFDKEKNTMPDDRGYVRTDFLDNVLKNAIERSRKDNANENIQKRQKDMPIEDR